MANNSQANSDSIDNTGPMAIDPNGNLYICANSTSTSGVIYQITPSGVLNYFVSSWNGANGDTGDGGPATAATISGCGAVASDAAGDIYFTDSSGIRVVSTNGTINTYLSLSQISNATQIPTYSIALGALALDANGNLYFRVGFSIYKATSTLAISKVAGNGQQGYSGDGGAATNAEFTNILSLAVDASNNLYVGDWGSIRMITTTGNISTVAGGVGYVAGTNDVLGYTGDGGAATMAKIGIIQGLSIDGNGSLYMADNYNHVIRTVTTAGIISTFVGKAPSNMCLVNSGANQSENDIPISQGGVCNPKGLAFDRANNLYISDSALLIFEVTPL